MEQINSRYHRLGHAFDGGPSYRRIVENESERIVHGEIISCQRTRRISWDRRTGRLGHAKSNTSCKLVINLKKAAQRAFCLHGDAIGHFAYHAEKAEAFEALAKLVRDITKAAP
jgi:hypothetical protein